MTRPTHSGVVQRFFRFVSIHDLTNQSVGVAFSGGPDSLALLICAAEAHRAGRIGNVIAIHVDHGVRLESATDARKAGELAQSVSVLLRSVRLELPSDASEADMRDARYAALAAHVAQGDLDLVMTGHHQRDQAETVILNMLSGSGLTGLSGIDPEGSLSTSAGLLRLYRPFLHERPDDLAELVELYGLAPVVDPTNVETDKTRNFVRHEVVPRLAVVNPGFELHLANLADIVRDEDSYLHTAANAAASIAINDRELDSLGVAVLPVALQRRVIRIWIGSRTDVDLSLDRCEAIRDAILSGAGDVIIEVGNGWQARQNSRRFTLHHSSDVSEEHEVES
jgi:tRNA(Ile)-lysidine synthase